MQGYSSKFLVKLAGADIFLLIWKLETLEMALEWIYIEVGLRYMHDF